MTDHRCIQETRLLRIERDEAAREAKYRERDEVARKALLELGEEIAAIGSNVAEQIDQVRESTGRQIRGLHAKIARLADELGGGK